MADLRSVFLGEFVGTMVLILLGDGVVANVNLRNTKGHQGGWIVITAGWAFAVVFGVTAAVAAGAPGFLNPAVAIPFAAVGRAGWDVAAVATAAEFLGAFVGAVLVYLAYKQHFDATEEPGPKLGVFCTIPQFRHLGWNFLTEAVGTFALVFGVLTIIRVGTPGYLTPYIVGMLVWGIGLSLGGPTGYAINPARDLGPRLAHAVLPIPRKGPSDWGYGLAVPLFGPLVGGLVGALAGLIL